METVSSFWGMIFQVAPCLSNWTNNWYSLCPVWILISFLFLKLLKCSIKKKCLRVRYLLWGYPAIPPLDSISPLWLFGMVSWMIHYSERLELFNAKRTPAIGVCMTVFHSWGGNVEGLEFLGVGPKKWFPSYCLNTWHNWCTLVSFFDSIENDCQSGLSACDYGLGLAQLGKKICFLSD